MRFNAAVKAAGGSKVVGAALWPDMAVDAAQRKLLNALSETHAERLKPSATRFVLRLARDKGFHDAAIWWLDSVGYSVTPVSRDVRESEIVEAVTVATSALNSALTALAEIQARRGVAK